MNSAWRLIFVIYFGQIADAYVDGEIGCYKMQHSIAYQATFNNNSGSSCKRYCFEEKVTHYAGTQRTECICFNTLDGNNVTKSDCTFICPGRHEEFCGGIHRITAYDGKRTTTTRSTATATVSSTGSVIPTVISTSNSTNNGILPIQYIMMIAVSVVIIVLVLIVMLTRRLKMRQKRRKLSKTGESSDSVSHGPRVELHENRLVASREDNVDAEYDTTTRSRPEPLVVSSVEDDYSRLRISEILCEDSNYSHVRNNQHGACALLEVDYCHLGRVGTKTSLTNNIHSSRAPSNYGNDQLNRSCHVQSANTGLKFGICNDDVYDKLQNKL